MQEYSKCHAYQTLLKITHNKKRNSITVHSNTCQLALQIFRQKPIITRHTAQEQIDLTEQSRHFWNSLHENVL